MKLFEMLGMNTPSQTGDVGVEIEIEGDVPAINNDRKWETVQDGSLRGGYEYITRGAIPVGSVHEYVEHLNKAFSKANATPSFSFRTSVHVHLNVLECTYAEIIRIIYMLWLFEPLLINASGEHRRGNRFCLSTQDSDSPVLTLEKVLRLGRRADLRAILSVYREDRNKYSAINMACLRTLGTIEVRTMEGNINALRIGNWCALLHRLKVVAMGFKNLSAIDDEIMSVGIRNFTQGVLGNLADEYDFQELEGEIGLQRSLLINTVYLNKGNEHESKNPSVSKGVGIRGGDFRSAVFDEWFTDEISAVPARPRGAVPTFLREAPTEVGSN